MKKPHNIKSQIMRGYLVILLVPIIMTLVTIFFSKVTVSKVNELSVQNFNVNTTKDAIIAHYSWITQLGDSIMEGVDFAGSLDPATCALGKILVGVSAEDRADPVIGKALSDLVEPHNYIHNKAAEIVELSGIDRNGAYNRYYNEIKPRVADVIAQITIATNRYMEIANQRDADVKNAVQAIMNIAWALAVIGIIAAVIIADKLAKQISQPVTEVSKWAGMMALGDNTYQAEAIDNLHLDPDNEISQMVTAFTAMATSVENNVRVVKRVADGDLTAYVDIRSNMDVLGQSLYRMVQSNDHMFAYIFDVSSNVAASAHEISKASSSLAETTSKQAATIEEITGSVSLINDLSKRNAAHVTSVMEAFWKIQEQVDQSSEKMTNLVKAVDAIRVASDQISVIIKTIDDISFQTNILALNAAIEAARAGEAGKGFAVVADEVRQLALKSADAAKGTKELIDNTVAKTHHGARIAAETSATFVTIHQHIVTTSEVVESIAVASGEQCASIDQVQENIQTVANAQSSTAAFSEESAASGEQMLRYAEILRDEMKKFNLRHRETGLPYIPEEKKNDAEFIRVATENYQRALEKGQITEKRLEFIPQ